MDILNQIMEFAKTNPIVLIIAYFLFKDKIDPFLAKLMPGTPAVPVPVPPGTPVVPVVVAPSEDRPVLDAILKLLPLIIPIIVSQIEQSKAKE
jgi:hypothetical protein